LEKTRAILCMFRFCSIVTRTRNGMRHFRPKSLDLDTFGSAIRKKKTWTWLEKTRAILCMFRFRSIVTGTRNGMRHFRPKSLDLGSSGSAIRKKTLGQCWKKPQPSFACFGFAPSLSELQMASDTFDSRIRAASAMVRISNEWESCSTSPFQGASGVSLDLVTSRSAIRKQRLGRCRPRPWPPFACIGFARSALGLP